MSCMRFARGHMARFTRLNECGAPVEGECSVVVTKGIVTAEFSPQTSEGNAIEVRNMAGELCHSDPACVDLTSVQVTLNFCDVDTDLFAIMTGKDPVAGADGDGIGFYMGKIRCDVGFALELWLGVKAGDSQCGVDGAVEYGYQLIPYISSGVIGDYTVGDDAITFNMTAQAKFDSPWGVGPYDVIDVGDGPGPLPEPFPGETEYGLVVRTTVPPPEPECGCTELVLPEPAPTP